MIERYSRLLKLSNFSKEKLSLLQSTNILIIGAGGVGQNISTILVTNGVENISIVDFDKVELGNLNRQFLVTEHDINKDKVSVVKNVLQSHNSDAHVRAINLKVDKDNVNELLKGHDLIIEATDNWPTKLIIADAAKKANIPLFHIGVDGYEGQFCLFKNKSLRDIVDEKVFGETKDGVLGPMVTAISSLAALYLIDYITKENPETDTLCFYNHKNFNLNKIKL